MHPQASPPVGREMDWPPSVIWASRRCSSSCRARTARPGGGGVQMCCWRSAHAQLALLNAGAPPHSTPGAISCPFVLRPTHLQAPLVALHLRHAALRLVQLGPQARLLGGRAAQRIGLRLEGLALAALHRGAGGGGRGLAGEGTPQVLTGRHASMLARQASTPGVRPRPWSPHTQTPAPRHSQPARLQRSSQAPRAPPGPRAAAAWPLPGPGRSPGCA